MMTHTYRVEGMTCGNCEAKVKSNLLMLPNVTGVGVSKEKQSATISMDKHISLSTFKNALDKKYSITAMEHNEKTQQAKSWLATYKPALLIFVYITAITILESARRGTINWIHGMNVFMAGFFLTFSFFKMLDIRGFANSYAMYDIVAKKVKAWGFIYAFVELALGFSYAINFKPLITNIITVVVMIISITGVLQSVLNKRKMQCACLGAVFNLPISIITIIEDALMIAMSGIMLIMLCN